MGLFENFPYTNFHELNLDWILSIIKKLDNEIDDFVQTNVLTYAEPIQWNITTQYSKNTVVVGPDGTAYMSIEPVPTNILLTNTDYWQPIFNYAETVTVLKKQIAASDMGDSSIAIVPVPLGGLFWRINTLYRATKTINNSTKLEPGINCELCTVEEAIKNVISPASDIGRSGNNITDSAVETSKRTARNIIDSSSGDYTETSNHKTIEAAQITEHTTENREIDVDGANSVHVDGTNTVNVGGDHTEVYAKTFGQRVTGKRTVNYDGGSEEIHKTKGKVTAPDFEFDFTNGFTYKQPEVFNDYFDYVPARGTNNAAYKLLVAGAKTEKLKELPTAENLGVVPGTVSDSVRTSNTAKINAALAVGKTIIFDNATYEFNNTLNLPYGSGLVGCGAQSKLLFYGNNNAIDVNLVYDPNPQFEHDTWSSVTITGLRIISATPNKTNGDGLHIQNYTFNVTCNKDVGKYWQLKGNGYALELRNSNISYLYIVGFNRNIFLEDYCAVLTLDHIICTNGIFGMVDNSHDSLVSNMLITFADKHGLVMNGNLDAHYSNIKVYQNGKAANDQTGYSGVNLNNLWGGQFSNLTSEENAGMGIQMTNCKGTVINAVASSNGYAPLSNSDEFSYSGMGLQDCEGIIGSLLAIDKHALYPTQAATQGYGFYSSSPKSAQLYYAEAGNRKTIKDFDWSWMCNLHPANNDMNITLMGANGVTVNSGKGRYHDNRIDITAELHIDAFVPSGNWLIDLSHVDYSSLTTNFKTWDPIYATASDTTGNSYPIKVVANEAVYAQKDVPDGTTLHVSVSVPVTIGT